MKKLILAFFILACAGKLMADNPSVWVSSNTATADSNQKLCTRGRAFFHGVIISSGVANATLTVVNSTMTPTKSWVIDSSAKGSYFFDTIAVTTNVPAGFAYTTVGTAQTNILYQCY